MDHKPFPWPPRSGSPTIHTEPADTAQRANRVPRVARDSAEGAAGVEEDAEFVAHINRRGRTYLGMALLVVLIAALFALSGCGGGSDEEDAALEAEAARRTVPTQPDCAADPGLCR